MADAVLHFCRLCIRCGCASADCTIQAQFKRHCSPQQEQEQESSNSSTHNKNSNNDSSSSKNTHKINSGVTNKAADYVGLGIIRSAWNDPAAAWVAFKAGDVYANHNHLDLGSFVFSRFGLRWAEDLGADNYGLPGYFSKDAERYTYYRLNNAGHNTLVLGQDSQDHHATGNIEVFQSAAGQSAWAVMDLSLGYTKHCKSVKRGIALVSGLQQLVILDQLDGCFNMTSVEWGLHTQATASNATGQGPVVLSVSGGANYKELTLQTLPAPSQGGRSCSGLSVNITPVRLAPPQDSTNGLNQVLFATSDPKCSVVAVSLADGDWTAPPLRPLEQWANSGPFA